MADKPDISMVDNRSIEEGDRPDKQSASRVIANIHVLGLTDDDADFYESYPPERRSKLVRKVVSDVDTLRDVLLKHIDQLLILKFSQDWRLVPMLACLYLISQLDRANIGNAKIEGLDKDLGLSGVQYNICNSIFFVPYVLLEVPSNVLLKKFSRPSVYLGILVTSWGIVMTCHGFVKNFPGLLILRLILGSLEAGFYPGAVYLCTFWCRSF